MSGRRKEIPACRRIYRELTQGIAEGQWHCGDLLPTEMALAAQYGVSRTTSRRALQMLAESGYIHRVQGKGSVVVDEKRHTPMIGLALAGFDALFGMDFVRGVFSEAAKQGYLVLMHTGYDTPQSEGICLRRLKAAGVAGLVVVPLYDALHDGIDSELSELPTVFADRRVLGIEAPLVCTDNARETIRLYRHLQSCGYRKIAFVSSQPSSTAVADRLRGFLRAAKQSGEGERRLLLTTLRSPLPSMDDAENRAEDIARIEQFLRANAETEAVIAHTYRVALLVREAAKNVGRAIPRDIAVACFDAPRGVETEPFLHISQNEFEIGAKAVQCLIDRTEGRAVPENVFVSAVLADGGSYLPERAEIQKEATT